MNDFAITIRHVESDVIFPITEPTIYINLQLITVSVATEAVAATAAATTKSICDIINSSEEVLDKSKLIAIIQSEPPAIQCQHYPVQLSPIKFDEMTKNKLMCVALHVKAEWDTH